MKIVKKYESFGDWVKAHALRLDSLDPEASFDDLEPFRDVIGGARIVALGESSHFVGEFCLLRDRLIRFLAELCGFTIYSLEFGFGEGFDLQKWMNGGGEESDLSALLSHFYYPSEIYDTFRRLRKYNAAAKEKIQFAGLDIPANGGSFFPSLNVVKNFLLTADPEAIPILQSIEEIAAKIDGRSTAQMALRSNDLPTAEKDALTASVSRLITRLETMSPAHVSEHGQKHFSLILHLLNGVRYLDYNARAMSAFIAGAGTSGDMGAKDKYMADSALLHLENAPSDSKMVLVAHNAHIQKTPVRYDGFLSCLPMGQRLAEALGKDYLAFGITSAGGNTAALYPDENHKFGFRIENTALEKPVAESIEAFLTNAGLECGFVTLRDIPKEIMCATKIRFDSEYLEMNVCEAFDGIFQIPVTTVAENIE